MRVSRSPPKVEYLLNQYKNQRIIRTNVHAEVELPIDASHFPILYPDSGTHPV